MIRYLSLEFYKIRRRGVFLTALQLCGVEWGLDSLFRAELF